MDIHWGARERIWSDLRFRKMSLTTVRKMDGRDWGLLQVRDRGGVGHEALAPSMGGRRAVVPSAQLRLWRRKERVQCQCGDPVGCHTVWGKVAQHRVSGMQQMTVRTIKGHQEAGEVTKHTLGALSGVC